MRVIRTFLTVSMLVSVCGCAAISGPTPAEEVMAVLTEYHTAEKAGDVDGMLAVISDDFSNSQGASKPMLRAFLEALNAQGVFKSLTVDTRECEVTVDGTNATLKPVAYTSSMGPASYAYQMKKEADGAWRITNSEQIN